MINYLKIFSIVSADNSIHSGSSHEFKIQLFFIKLVETDRHPVVFFFLGTIHFLKMEEEGKSHWSSFATGRVFLGKEDSQIIKPASDLRLSHPQSSVKPHWSWSICSLAGWKQLLESSWQVVETPSFNLPPANILQYFLKNSRFCKYSSYRLALPMDCLQRINTKCTLEQSK